MFPILDCCLFSLKNLPPTPPPENGLGCDGISTVACPPLVFVRALRACCCPCIPIVDGAWLPGDFIDG